MKMKLFSRGSKGFTLVELLVVIAIIALLVAIVFPAISNALLRGRVTATSVTGRNIYQSIIAAQTADIYLSTASVFPNTSSDNPDINYSDTSGYFTYLVENGVLDVGWGYFAAPGITAGSVDETTLQSANNAWRIVDESENMPDTAPMLWTRNLNIDTLTENTELSLNDFIDTQAPYQDSGFAFVTRGGGAYALAGRSMRDNVLEEVFRMPKSQVVGAPDKTYTVLQP